MPDKSLKIKICGMRDPENMREISALSPDYMGFIYYPSSKRFAGSLSSDIILRIPGNIQRVGVFVNKPYEEVHSISQRMNFRILQLHGDESPEYCKRMKEAGYEIFKAFSVGEGLDSRRLQEYTESCDFFLLDTAGGDYGGTGKKFDWKRLEEYSVDKPFLLSGGIGPGDIEEILTIRHPQLYGVDLNSRFETEPGKKSVKKLSGFISQIRAGLVD